MAETPRQDDSTTDARAMPWSEARPFLIEQAAEHEQQSEIGRKDGEEEYAVWHQHVAAAMRTAVALGDRCAQAEQRIALLEDALRLLLRFHSSTEHPRWGEWAGRLFDDPDEDEVSLRETEDALRALENK